jgi:hypothetical protein
MRYLPHTRKMLPNVEGDRVAELTTTRTLGNAVPAASIFLNLHRMGIGRLRAMLAGSTQFLRLRFS